MRAALGQGLLWQRAVLPLRGRCCWTGLSGVLAGGAQHLQGEGGRERLEEEGASE